MDIGKQSSPLIVIFLPLGVMAFISAFGLRLRRHIAWTAAMAVQAIHLLVFLILYFTTRLRYVSPFMAWGVLMVIYLNYSDVANAFRPHRARPWEVPAK